jgi:DNA-binding transcriptional LysR family regulator
MNDKQIECFLETAKHLSFTKAAQNLYLPQPAVSRYISALEQELGVTLFIRENSRHIELSPEGTMYFNMFQRYKAELYNIRRTLSSSTSILRIGYNVGWDVSTFLPNAIRECLKEQPDLKISFECLSFRDLVQSINDKQLDAIITTDNYVEGKTDYVRNKFTSISRNVVFSEFLPGYENIKTPADLEPYTFYMIDDPKVGALCQDIEILFRPFGFIPKFQAVSNISSVFAAIENGIGVAILDEWYQGINRSDMHSIKLDDTLPISLVWHRSTLAPSLDLLKRKICEEFER